MKTTNTLAQAGNGFSWRRVAEVGRFYLPIIRGQIIVYTLASLFIALITLMPFGPVAQVGLFTLSWSALPLIFEVGPCIFARGGDTRIVERLIPARGPEKFTFIILYLFIAVPVMVFVLPELALRLYMLIPSLQNDAMLDILTLRFDKMPAIVDLMNAAGTAAGAVTCLFVVYQSRTGRILKAVVAVFCVKFGMAFLGAIWGMSISFKKGFIDGMAGNPDKSNEMFEMIYDMMGASTAMTVITMIIIVYCAAMFWLSYRAINRRNL